MKSNKSTMNKDKVTRDAKREYTDVERTKIGRNAGVVGIALNVVLFAFKVTVGVISSSVSVIADAVNNLSDALSSVIVMVGYILSGKPADRKHPFGHARIEYLCSLFISLIITFLGFELFKSSVESIISGEGGAQFTVFALVVMCASMLVKLFLALFFHRTGKKIASASLKATAVDSLGDVAATAAVVVGMLLSGITGKATDGVLGCIIAVYIFVLGVKLIIESSDTLLGSAPDLDVVKSVVERLESYDGVMGIHDLVMHNYGEGRFFASVHVEVNAEEDIMLSHDMIDNIEREFARDFNINLVIHLDPVCVGDKRVDALKAEVADILHRIASENASPVSMHDFRVVFGVTHTNLIFDVVVSYEFPLSEAELLREIEKGVSELDGTYFSVVTVDRDFTSSI